MNRGFNFGRRCFNNMKSGAKPSFRPFYTQQRAAMSFFKVNKMAFATLPQLQAAKLESMASLTTGMINSITIEGISLSLDCVEENDAEDDDGRW
ncbi:unnamed protein product [Moneuplotes crassus]|uniref:Uncharacterized protein n=1 Tax=Euplotes crassus TaxID=5936 RepID=A0AAD1Y0W0_EUPCR|nr:unnamed protein product [Moneuplotes crassus]